jgi:hypothetical protein
MLYQPSALAESILGCLTDWDAEGVSVQQLKSASSLCLASAGTGEGVLPLR